MCTEADPGGGWLGRSPPLELAEVTFFTMILYNSERHLAANGDLTAKYYWIRPPPKLMSWTRPCMCMCSMHFSLKSTRFHIAGPQFIHEIFLGYRFRWIWNRGSVYHSNTMSCFVDRFNYCIWKNNVFWVTFSRCFQQEKVLFIRFQ